MTALIQATGLTVKLDGKTVLSPLNFTLNSGEIVTIVGPNGSGKTTFLRAMIGAQPSDGSLIRNADAIIGYVPQALEISRTMPLTVDRFLALAGKTNAAQRLKMLDRVGSAELVKRQMFALSGGQFQRVVLAKALLRNPKILALDEPTKGLDQPGIAAFYRLIDEIRTETGCAVLMVSHDLHVVMSASDRVICLNGHICCEGTPTVVAEAPEYRAMFGIGTGGALALYQHHHDHNHSHEHTHEKGSSH